MSVGAKDLLLGGARALGGFALARAATRGQLRILAYHGLWTTPGLAYGDRLFMPPDQFEARMRWLKHSGHPVLPLGEAVELLERDALPAGATVITIDDGWRSTYTHMLPIFETFGFPATAYVTSWYVEAQVPIVAKAADYALLRSGAVRLVWRGLDLPTAMQAEREAAAGAAARFIDGHPLQEREPLLRDLCATLGVPVEPWWSGGQFHLMTRDEVADAARRGLDIQLHTHRHRRPDANFDQLLQEIADNRAVLGKCVDPERLVHFCYPSGGGDARAPALLAGVGVRSAALCDQGLNPPGTDPFFLRRFLDGRSVSMTMFQAYMSGALELYENARRTGGQ